METGMALSPQKSPSGYMHGVDACAYLGCNPSTIYRHVKAGKLRAAKLGGILWVRKADLDKLRPSAENLDKLLGGNDEPPQLDAKCSAAVDRWVEELGELDDEQKATIAAAFAGALGVAT
jgi:excisionase family DNA binding protein